MTTISKHQQEQGQEWFNFINSLNAPSTKRMYVFRLEQFLNYCKVDLHSFLKLPQQQITNLITKYLVEKRVSKSSKNVIFFAIKHACEQNDLILNWKKIKKFIKTEKTGNEISGKDRGYTHEEIQQILSFSEQRLRTAFLILASTGMRIGGLDLLKVGDLERIDDLYKITVYSGEEEHYITFTTPEAAKEINSYLDFRRRRGENITSDSYLIVKKFSPNKMLKGKPFTGYSLRILLQDNINKSGLRFREIDSKNPHKRKEVSLLHGLRKFYTKQLVDSNVKAEIREMLLSHEIGLTDVYYKPTELEMLNEYYKAVPLLTISNEERLKFKLEEKIQIEKTRMQVLEEKVDELRKTITEKQKVQKEWLKLLPKKEKKS
jgi:integrase